MSLKQLFLPNYPDLDTDQIQAFTKSNSHYFLSKWKLTSGLGQWNWAAFFLSPFWLISRRMIGWSVFIGTIIVLFDFWITANPFHFTFCIELMFLTGLLGNRLYLSKFKKNIAKFGKNEKELATRGGIKWLYPLYLLIGMTLYSLILPSLFGIHLFQTDIIKIEAKSFFWTLTHPKQRAEELTMLQQDYQKVYFSGNFERSIMLNENVYKLAALKLGTEHETTVALQSELIGMKLEAGNYQEAFKLNNELLKHYQIKFGKNHLFVTFMMNNLASNYIYQGLHKKAKSECTNAMLIWEHYPKDMEHPTILLQKASLYSNMGVIKQIYCDYEAALRYHNEALELVSRASNGYTLNTCVYLERLGDYYKEIMQLDEARQYYRKSKKIIETILKKDNPMIASTYQRLGELYYLKRDFNRAEEWGLQAYAINKALHGNEHIATAESAGFLGKIYFAQGKLYEAEKHLTKGLEITKTLLGKKNFYYATLLSTYADYQFFRNNLQKGEHSLIASLEILTYLFDSYNPRLLVPLEQLADYYDAIADEPARDYRNLQIKQIKKRSPLKQLPQREMINMDRNGIIL